MFSWFRGGGELYIAVERTMGEDSRENRKGERREGRAETEGKQAGRKGGGGEQEEEEGKSTFICSLTRPK